VVVVFLLETQSRGNEFVDDQASCHDVTLLARTMEDVLALAVLRFEELALLGAVDFEE